MKYYYLHLLPVVDSVVQTFLTLCHLVVDSDLHVIPIISLLQDASKGNMAFVLTLAIANTQL